MPLNVPEGMDFWEWLVQTGLIEGDPTYYSDGLAQPDEYQRAINVASTFFTDTGGGTSPSPSLTPVSPTPAEPRPPQASPTNPVPVPSPSPILPTPNPTTTPNPSTPIDWKARAAALYPWLPPQLLDLFASAWAEHGDASLALAETRANPIYESFFPGIKRDDGSLRMTEQEWFATQEAYSRLFREFGLNPTVFSGRFEELMEGSVSPAELAGRLGAAYEQIITNIPQVREFYASTFGLDLTDEAIFASFLDPDVSDAILNRRLSVAQVGGEALARGFDIGDTFAGRLASAGVDQGAARQFFADAEGRLPTLDELARRFSDPDPTFDIDELAEASIFGSADQSRRLRRLLAAEQSLFSDQTATVSTSDQFTLTGLTQR